LDAGDSCTVNSNSDDDAEDDAEDGNDLASPALALCLLPRDLPMAASYTTTGS
jgi:hypothetical protein